jgi:uncharacterized protein YegP (UPF0339 family)
MMMPRTMEEILAHSDDLARRFEEFEPSADSPVKVTPLGEVYGAVQARAAAEQALAIAVSAARDGGSSWAVIGQLLGTTGEAARQKYGASRADEAPSSAMAASVRYEVYKTTSGYRWRLKARGEIVATSRRVYATKADAQAALRAEFAGSRSTISVPTKTSAIKAARKVVAVRQAPAKRLAAKRATPIAAKKAAATAEHQSR